MALSAREISLQDIKATESNQIQYSSKHVKHLPPGTVTDFEWKNYCPSGFRLIQALEDIDSDAYTLSICCDETLRKLSSGKPGTMFLLSKDDRFIIKILRKSEIKVILELLPSYYCHIQKYRSTLLCKIYGAHAVKHVGGVKIYFAVTSNVLQSDILMNRVYDLKGSSLRQTGKKVKIREKTILKDLDLDFCFYLDPLTRHRLLKQIRLDCELLENEGIMDYSLMLGFHIKSSHQGLVNSLSTISNASTSRESFDSVSSKFRKTMSFNSPDRSSVSNLTHSSTLSQESVDSGSSIPEMTVSTSSIESMSSIPGLTISTDSMEGTKNVEQAFGDILLQPNTSGRKFGMLIPARAVRVRRTEGGSLSGSRKKVRSEDWYDVTLYLGIVDTFKNYSVRKRIEHCYKSIHLDSKAISAVNPRIYSSRFQEFLRQVFLVDQRDQ